MQEQNPAALPAGGIFHGRYEVVRCIKAGGMGAVYEVIHLETRRRRALKVMLPSIVADPGLRARFRLEATVAAEVESEHIVETFDAGVDEATGAPFLVMELLRGEDLSAVLQRRGVLPAAEVVLFLSQLALALDKTHAAGIVHRDLKPENLFLTQRDDGSPRIKVLDYGIAKVVAQGATARQTQVIGTPLYMSPEQVRGEGTIGAASDLLALGHIAYTLLAGEPYWQEDLGAGIHGLLLRIVAGPREPASARAIRRRGVPLPSAFDGWFTRAMAAEAGARFAGAKPMVAALGEALGVGATRTPLPAPVPVVVPGVGAAHVVPDVAVATTVEQGRAIGTPAAGGAPSVSGLTNVTTVPLLLPPEAPKRSMAVALVVGGLAMAGFLGVGAVMLGRGLAGTAPGTSADPASMSTSTANATASIVTAPSAPPSITVAPADVASAAPVGSAPPPSATSSATVAPKAPPPSARPTAKAPPSKAPPRPPPAAQRPKPAYDPSKEM